MKSSLPVFKGKNPILPGAEFLRNPFLFTIAHAQEMGDFYRIPFFFRRIFVSSNLEVIAHVLQKNQKNYVKSIAYRNLRLALGNGLLTSEGEFWRRQRRLTQPAFYKPQLEEIFKSMGEVAGSYCGELKEKIATNDTLDISKEMMGVTAGIVLKTLFSTDNSADVSEMYRIMVDSQDYIIYRTTKPHLIPIAYLNGRHRHFRRDMDWFDRQLFSILEKRRKDPAPPADLLTMLLHARDEETGEAMSDRQLRDEAITLFAAGHETSSNALSWTLYLLSQHPEAMEKLRAEIDTVLG
ncbi:MAG: cytochrome P450, partial [Saprospiraceae bacterium]